jgi:hypothetical protein
MRKHLSSLIAKLWNDDCGAVLASEYVIVGTVAVLGTASGMAAMRDATNAELEDFAGSVRAVRQEYAPQLQRYGVAPRPGQGKGQAPSAATFSAPAGAETPAACTSCP